MDPVLVLFVLATATLFPLTIRAQTDTLQRSGTRPSCDTSAWNCPLVDSTGAFADSSTAITSSSLYGSLSASYASSSNWNGQNLRNFALVGNLLYTHSLFAAKHGHLHQVMADLGYQKFVDSTWVKSIDRLQVNLLWNKTSRKFNLSLIHISEPTRPY